MAFKKIKSKDVLGSNYYVYEVTSSNYTPSLNSSITISCTLKSVYDDPVANKSLTLYQNNNSVSSSTTNSNGVCTWTITCNTGGLQLFRVGTETIEVFVDNKASVNHTHTASNITDFPSLHTVATSGSYDDLTDKPTIPSAISVDSSLSTSSTNPVQNKIVKSALDGKSDTNHTHSEYNKATYSQTIGSSSSGAYEIGKLTVDGSETTIYGKDTDTVYTHPNDLNTTKTSGLYKIALNSKGHVTSATSVEKSDITALGIPSSDTTYSLADGTNNGLSSNDYTTTEKNKLANLHTVATTGSYNDLEDKPTIPTDVSDLTDTENTSFTPKSHTHTKNQITDFPTIPSASSTTPSADTTSGSVGSNSNYAKADHTHPKSTLYAEATHTHSNYNKTTYSQTLSSSTDGAYEIGKINVDGTDTTLYGKDTNTIYTHPSTHSSSMITDSNTYSNIGNTASTLENIISNIDSKIGSLLNVELIEVVQSLGTASASTMNKLYLVAETTGATNDNYEIFITVRTGTSGNYSYAWEKVDTARIDLSNYLTNSNAQSTYLSKTDATNTYYTKTETDDLLDDKVDSTDLSTVATTGSYTDLNNIPSTFTPTSHNHTTSQITDFPTLSTVATTGDYDDLTDKPSIPSKTSDLTNDGDGTNVFVKNNDSRLSDNRTPTSHTHGNLQNDGKVGTSNNASKNVVTDSNGKITTEDKADLSVYATSTDLSDHNTSATAHNNIQIKPIEYIVGTQTGETNAWTGTSTKIASLSAGICILYKLPYASTTSNATLNLTLSGGGTSGAKALYFTNTTRVKQQFGVNAIICLMYDGSYWRVVNPYTNTTTNYYDRNRFQTTGVKIKTAFTDDYGLLCGDDTGYIHLGSGSSFSLSHPLLYYASTTDMEADTYTTNGYSNFGNVDATYIKANVTLTVDKMVYLVGTVSNNIFTVDSTIITQTPSTTGKVYLPIGLAISTTNIIFFPIYNLVIYDGSDIVPYVSSHSHSNYLTSHQDITGKEDKSNKVTNWSSTTTDNHYPSEKLVKDSLDNKSDTGHTHSDYASSTHSHGNISNTGIMSSKDSVSNKNVVTDSTGKIIVEDKPTIPSKTSDLTNDSNFISTSSTNGLVKNDGSIDSNSYLTTSVASSTYVAKENGKGLFSGSYNDLTNKPSIPTDVSDLTDNNDTTFTPKSHTHTKNQITDFPTLSTVATSGSYNDLSNKPTIPTNTSDLTNDGSDGTNPFLTQHQDISGKADVNDLGDTAFSNNYNDLNNLPTIPTVPTNVGAFTNDSGYLTSQDISGKANISDLGDVAFSNDYTDLDNKPSQNVFYGTCSTSTSAQTKVVDVDNWSFTTGNILFVKFTNTNSYDGTVQISIDETVKDIKTLGGSRVSQYRWRAGELVGFVYDGTDMLMLEGGVATPTYYGMTKLSDSTSSSSSSVSATSYAVKQAYDLADSKQDELVSGTNIKTINNQTLLGNGNLSVGDVNASDLLDLIYPIGSIYMSVSNVDPSVLFGGTWEAIEDKFLLSSGTTYTPTYDSDGFANKTGGEASHTLTIDEMPSHTHEQNPHHHSFNRYQNTGSTTNYGTNWTNQKLQSQNTSDTTATNKNTGGGQAHNNMPPYLVVNVWKRTA